MRDRIKREKSKILIVWFLLTVMISSHSRATSFQVEGEPSSTETSDYYEEVISFEMVDNRIIIPVLLQENLRLRMILDTGMPIAGALLFRIPDGGFFGRKPTGQVMIGGPGGLPRQADLFRGMQFGIGRIKLEKQDLIVLSEGERSEIHSRQSDGVIGFSIFSRFVTEIDYVKREVRLVRSPRFDPLNKGVELPLIFHGNYPHVTGIVSMKSEGEVSLELLLDTGANVTLALNEGSHDSVILPERNLPVRIGKSISSEMNGSLARIPGLRLGPFSLENILVSFFPADVSTPHRVGMIGGAMLKKFNIVLDYSGRRLFLTPNQFYPVPFEFDMAGLQTSLSAEGERYVDRVIPDSPAAQAGILVGDVIELVDGQPVAAVTSMEWISVFTTVGRELILSVRRGNVVHKVRLKLRRLI